MSIKDVRGRPGGIVCLGFVAWCAVLTTWTMAAGGPAPKVDKPTFTRDVAPILQKHCQTCHRRGQVAPFPLETYEHARKRSSDIATVVAEKRMPPWKPAHGYGPELKDDRSLAPAEIAVLTAWAETGTPQGDPKDLPPPVKYPEGWALGTPDLVLEMAEEYDVPASGPDIYRCFVIPTNLPKGVYLSAVEYRPGNRRVTHHMMAFIDTEGGARARDEADPGPGYTEFTGPGVEVFGDLGGWLAGTDPTHLPEGVGRFFPKKADVILQIHYHPSGRRESDRTQLGFYFSRKPVKQTLHWNNASCPDLVLPAGKARVQVKASWYVPVDVEVLAVTPHMHQLGHDMRVLAILPGGRKQHLIYIPDWDPAWQATYYFDKPVTLPKGSVVHIIGHFDNSAHPRNPHSPPQIVRWGHGVNEEMCIGYIGVVKKGQDLTRGDEKDDLFDIFLQQREKNFKRDQTVKARRARDK